MSFGRSFIRGPRFALRSTENVRACIACVYGNGDHAEWCEKRTLGSFADPPNFQGEPITPASFNQFCTLDGISERVHVPAASPDRASSDPTSPAAASPPGHPVEKG